MGWWVTDRVVAPRLGETSAQGTTAAGLEPLSPAERRGLWFATAFAALLTIVILWGTVPADGFLRDAKTGDLLHSPFMSGIVTLIFVSGVGLGVAYGLGAKTIKNDADLVRGMSKAMETLAGYLVLVFFAAQFVAYFNWSNLGLIVAVKGADALRGSGLSGVPLLLAFVFFTAFINLFIGSASAKWAVMAPIFVPMFSLLGFSPELTQCAFRIGDSCTNIISPMMSYFALIIAFYQRYDKGAGIGSLVATMLPYSIVFLIGWSIVFAAWVGFELPLGPGVSSASSSN
jgi:aminobenzoyl-glutamate transport protein